MINDTKAEFDGLSFWALAAGPAFQSVGSAEAMPKLDNMFRHVTDQIMSEKTELSVSSDNQSVFSPEELLKMAWPICWHYLGKKHTQGNHVIDGPPQKYWSIICGAVAQDFINSTKDVLDPSTALTICMESAIYCSKIISFENNEKTFATNEQSKSRPQPKEETGPPKTKFPGRLSKPFRRRN